MKRSDAVLYPDRVFFVPGRVVRLFARTFLSWDSARRLHDDKSSLIALATTKCNEPRSIVLEKWFSRVLCRKGPVSRFLGCRREILWGTTVVSRAGPFLVVPPLPFFFGHRRHRTRNVNNGRGTIYPGSPLFRLLAFQLSREQFSNIVKRYETKCIKE